MNHAPRYGQKVELPWSDSVWVARREHAVFLRAQGCTWRETGTRLGV